jgi:3-methyladenine DNA glycosylase AlkD
MDIIITFFVSFALGWLLRELYAQYRVKSFMGKIETAVVDDVKANIIRIIIEHENDTYYVYNAENKSFMAQGNTRKELEKNLASRYPGKLFGAEPDNLKSLGFDK